MAIPKRQLRHKVRIKPLTAVREANYDIATYDGAQTAEVDCLITEISEAERMTILGEFPDVQHRITVLPTETRLTNHALVTVVKGPAGVKKDDAYEVVSPPAVRSEIGHDKGFLKWAYIRKQQ